MNIQTLKPLLTSLFALATLTCGEVEARAKAFVQHGQAVYYGGRYDRATRMTAAHLTLPFGTWVRVTHQRTGRSVLVKINDRGPFYNPRRIVDLSSSAAQALGILREGVAPVRLEVVRPAR